MVHGSLHHIRKGSAENPSQAAGAEGEMQLAGPELGAELNPSKTFL